MAKTHEQFQDELSKITSTIELRGKYTKATERIDVQCTICGKQWSPKAYSLLQGKGCAHCSAIRGANNSTGKTRQKSNNEFVDQIRKIDETIKVLGIYENGHKKIECKCLRCEHTWSAMPYSLLQGHGCPRCAKSGTSFMEQFLYLSFCEVFGKENVISRDKELIGMEIDIYIPNKKIAFEPGNWYLHKRSIKRDEEKRKRCKEKSVTLYTIYDNYRDCEDMPFDEYCMIFQNDLNKGTHEELKKLVYILFNELNVNREFSLDEWNKIEEQAYQNSKSITHDEFLDALYKVRPDIEVIGIYKNANIPIRVKCRACGFLWDGVPASMLSGDGCRKCGTIKAHDTFRKHQEAFVREVQQANTDIEVIGKYQSRHTPVRARCKICGFEWEPLASSLLRGSNHKGWRTIHKQKEKTIDM